MKYRIAKKIMTGRSSYNRRCEQLRPIQMLDDGNVFVPAWKDIDRIRRAAKVYFRHLNRSYYDGNTGTEKNITIKISCSEEEKCRGISDTVYTQMK